MKFALVTFLLFFLTTFRIHPMEDDSLVNYQFPNDITGITRFCTSALQALSKTPIHTNENGIQYQSIACNAKTAKLCCAMVQCANKNYVEEKDRENITNRDSKYLIRYNISTSHMSALKKYTQAFQKIASCITGKTIFAQEWDDAETSETLGQIGFADGIHDSYFQKPEKFSEKEYLTYAKRSEFQDEDKIINLLAKLWGLQGIYCSTEYVNAQDRTKHKRPYTPCIFIETEFLEKVISKFQFCLGEEGEGCNYVIVKKD